MKRKGSFFQYPYILWSVLFVVVPIFLIIYFSITSADGGFTLSNYSKMFNSLYMIVFANSVKLALISTAICFFLGYPTAYIISKAGIKKRNLLMLFLVIPMWMNFLLRTYAWMSILGKNGIINTILTAIGFHPVDIMYTDAAVILGMIYNFLPFMIIPIYTVLIKIDKDVIKAAGDLGANRLVIFKRIIFPLSIPGIMSGITMVFMPAVSTFVISNLLGGGQYMLIGNLIETQFTTVGDWYFGSALSILMMVIIIISMTILNKFDKNNDINGGARLW